MAADCGFYISDDFGQPPKDAVVAHLRTPPPTVVDLGVDKYYSAAAARHVASDPTLEARGVIVCGTGTGVAIFTNKYPGVYATHCASPSDAVNTRSINTCNLLALSGIATPPAAAISDAWFSTPFRVPCPASGDDPLPEDIQRFFDSAPDEMAAIPEGSAPVPDSACAICSPSPEKGDGVRAENKRG